MNELNQSCKNKKDKINEKILSEPIKDTEKLEYLPYSKTKNYFLSNLEINILEDGINSSKKKEEKKLKQNHIDRNGFEEKIDSVPLILQSKNPKKQMNIIDLFKQNYKKNEKNAKNKKEIKKIINLEECKEKKGERIPKIEKVIKSKKASKSQEDKVDSISIEKIEKVKPKKSKEKKLKISKEKHDNNGEGREESIKISKKHKLIQENDENVECIIEKIRKKKLKVSKSDDYKRKKELKSLRKDRKLNKSEMHIPKRKGRPPKE